MKKLILLLTLLFFPIALLLGQNNKIDFTGMSNYEKYIIQKNSDSTHTINIFKSEKPEYDDLYYISLKNDSLKKAQKDLRIAKRLLRKEKQDIKADNDTNYYDYDPFLYTNLIYGFRYPFAFNYHFGNYWNYSYYSFYDPFFWDPWYSDFWFWNTGYYNPFHYRYNYWYGYNNWYHPIYYSSKPMYNRTNTPDYRRRERQSNYSTNIVQQNKRTAVQTISRRTANPQDKPIYNQTRRSSTPSYTAPRMNIRPSYNNSNTQRSRNIGPTPSRTVAPTRRMNSSSAPSRSSSNSYAPSRSSTNSFNSGNSGMTNRNSGSTSSGSNNRSGSTGRR